jgi:hypothetical protein
MPPRCRDFWSHFCFLHCPDVPPKRMCEMFEKPGYGAVAVTETRHGGWGQGLGVDAAREAAASLIPQRTTSYSITAAVVLLFHSCRKSPVLASDLISECSTLAQVIG